jgi:HlyD family type I secretion membrane fusion protein
MADGSNLVLVPGGAIEPRHRAVLRLGRLGRKANADSPLGPIIVGAIAFILLIGAFGSWSATFSLASGAIAPGEVIVEGNRRAVQHRDGGPVKAVLVREGQKVEKEQPLLELDLSEVAAEATALKSTRLQTIARLTRLKAEAADKTVIVWPDLLLADKSPEVANILQQEQSLFDARSAAYTSNELQLKEQIAGSKSQIEGLGKRLVSTKEQYQSLIDERNSLQPLVEKGLVVRTRILSLERSASGVQADIQTIQNSISSEEANVILASTKIDQQHKDWQQAVAKEITEAESRLAEAEPRLTSAAQRLSRGMLVAPEAGYVYNLSAFSPGAVIIPGQTVLEIVPADEALVLQVEINPNDIDRVHPPANVTIHLQPYDAQMMETITGVLQKVSADRFDDPQDKKSYFKGIVKIDQEPLKRQGVVLMPGMPGDAIIETGERTIISYLLSPLFRIFNFALREK